MTRPVTDGLTKRKMLGIFIKIVAMRIFVICAVIGLMCAAYVAAANAVIKSSASGYIIDTQSAAGLDADCILVLGAGVNENGEPRLLLRDRLNTGTQLYQMGASNRLLMSGDHGRKDYDEVNGMKNYAVRTANIEPDDIFMDHAGFSTYESMYRARDVFDVDSVIIVTQKYHLYRAVYDARSLGLDARGVACDPGEYHGQIWLDMREVLARSKDLIYCIFKPLPTYLGEVIPISGSGAATAG